MISGLQAPIVLSGEPFKTIGSRARGARGLELARCFELLKPVTFGAGIIEKLEAEGG